MMMTPAPIEFAVLAPAFWMPSGGEWIVLLIIGLLIFGRRLPEVGRWLGQGIVEFKKGVKGITDEIEEESDAKRPERLRDDAATGHAASTSGAAEKTHQNT